MHLRTGYDTRKRPPYHGFVQVRVLGDVAGLGTRNVHNADVPAAMSLKLWVVPVKAD